MTEIRDQQSVLRAELPLAPGDVDKVALPLPPTAAVSVSDAVQSFERSEKERLRRIAELRGTVGDVAHKRELRKRVDEVVRGKVNWNGVFTLTDGGATATVVQDERVTPDCEISLHPLTANACSILGKVYAPLATLLEGTAYRADPVGQFTVQHPIVAAVDFTYRYSIKG